MQRLLALLLAALFALPGAARDTRLAVHHWSTRDGLPQDTIRGLAQTSDGSLWMATMGGLVRFDGQQSEAFDIAGHPQIGTSRATCVGVDSAGEILVGTAVGKPLRRSRGEWIEIHLPNPCELPVSDVLVDSAGVRWNATVCGPYRLERGSQLP